MPRLARTADAARRRLRWAGVGLILAAWALYASAVHFGLAWDDPLWFGRVVGRSLGELIRPNPTFQFYRPGTLLYNRLFIRADGSIDAPVMHLVNLSCHALNCALAVALARRLRLSHDQAVAVGALFAFHPFLQQAVVWMAPQQPLTTAVQQAAWLSWLIALDRPDLRRRALLFSLAAFAAALTLQEATIAVAPLPTLLWFYRWRARHPHTRLRDLPRVRAWRRDAPWASAYLALAVAYLSYWLIAPRLAGYVDWGFQLPVLAYLAQAFVWPLWRLHLVLPAWLVGAPGVAATTAGILIALLWQARRRGRGLLVVAMLAWAGLATAPGFVGLDFAYVAWAPRLLTFAALPLAVAWTAALWGRRAWLNALVVAATAALGAYTAAQLNRPYADGARHMRDMTDLLAAAVADGRPALAFINFPDQLLLRRPPFPLGNWGLPLAPVSTELADFGRLLNGRAPATTSRAMPSLDQDAREAGPYLVAMRGVIVPPEELLAVARGVADLYVSRYTADGRMTLQWAGGLRPAAAAAECLAVFGGHTCLRRAEWAPQADPPTLVLTWQALARSADHDTVLVHAGPTGAPPVQQADGAAWRELLPRRFWPTDVALVDVRALPGPLPAGSTVRLGLYNWVQGGRLPGVDAAGRPLPDDLYELPP